MNWKLEVGSWNIPLKGAGALSRNNQKQWVPNDTYSTHYSTLDRKSERTKEATLIKEKDSEESENVTQYKESTITWEVSSFTIFPS